MWIRYIMRVIKLKSISFIRRAARVLGLRRGVGAGTTYYDREPVATAVSACCLDYDYDTEIKGLASASAILEYAIGYDKELASVATSSAQIGYEVHVDGGNVPAVAPTRCSLGYEVHIDRQNVLSAGKTSCVLDYDLEAEIPVAMSGAGCNIEYDII
jgi:hypothetical protein